MENQLLRDRDIFPRRLSGVTIPLTLASHPAAPVETSGLFLPCLILGLNSRHVSFPPLSVDLSHKPVLCAFFLFTRRGDR